MPIFQQEHEQKVIDQLNITPNDIGAKSENIIQNNQDDLNMNANVQANRSVQHLQSPQLPIRNYNEFYCFYLTEHRNITSRRLHVLGSVIGGYWIAKAIRHRKPKYVLYGLVPGYACAWIGHFVYEKNKPASFKQPFYSFISDWRMLSDIVRGNLSLKCRSLDKIPS